MKGRCDTQVWPSFLVTIAAKLYSRIKPCSTAISSARNAAGRYMVPYDTRCDGARAALSLVLAQGGEKHILRREVAKDGAGAGLHQFHGALARTDAEEPDLQPFRRLDVPRPVADVDRP